MDVRFDDDDLDRLETDPHFTARLAPGIVKAYRKRLQQIRAATDERDLRKLKSLHFEKLEGRRKSQHSMRLNDQFRLVVELEEGSSTKTIVIVAVEDYH